MTATALQLTATWGAAALDSLGKNYEQAKDRHHYLHHHIASTAEEVWAALTNPDITQQYWFKTRIESEWKVGSKVIYRRDGKITDEHTLLKFEPPRVLSYTFRPLYEEFRREPPSRVTFEITAAGSVARLVTTHDEFDFNSKVYIACSEGWPAILSNLKTLLETGKPLPEFTFARELDKYRISE